MYSSVLAPLTQASLWKSILNTPVPWTTDKNKTFLVTTMLDVARHYEQSKKMQKYPMICVTGCFCLWAACHFLKTKTLNFGICSILFGPAGRFPPPAVQRSETVAALQYEG